MIKLIVGTKGSGKTKAMIDQINDAVKTSKGNVVVVEKGMKLTYDIAPAARLIDLDEYKIDGGVPEVLVEVDDLSAYNVGYLIYFFWRACACSGYLLGVNPFNQPGVESYKKNMFALLGKPGYEGLTAELEAKLK